LIDALNRPGTVEWGTLAFAEALLNVNDKNGGGHRNAHWRRFNVSVVRWAASAAKRQPLAACP
jgi:hypothetical protein